MEEGIWNIAQATLPPAEANKLYNLTLIRGVTATIAIEGSTLSEEEVSQIERGIFPKRASRAYEEQEAENIIALYNHIAGQMLSGDPSGGQPAHITVDLIREYNRMVLAELELGRQ